MVETNESAELVKIMIENQDYEYKKENQHWKLRLRKSEVQVHEEKDLALLKVKNPLVLDTAIQWEEDAVTFLYSIPAESLSFEEIRALTKAEKIRAMINIAEMKELLKLPLTFFLHPENIVFDYNLLPKIAYRGLAEKMPPKVTNEEILLRQYKCLIIDLFEKDANFTNLYEGQLDIKKGSAFINEIISKQTFSEVEKILIDYYNQTVTTDRQTLKQVKKTKFQVMKQLSIWMSALVVLLIIPLVYLLFFKLPFDERMQEADAAFMKNDYEATITTLEPVKTKKLPYTQKYILSYSFIQGKNLNDQQKKLILNNVTLRSDENYLDYWIENGRGNLDEAIDIAKNLEESDLIMYGITEKIDQVRNDTKLSGTEKEEQIDALEQDYKKYSDKRTESLNLLEETQASTEESAGDTTTDSTVSSSSKGGA